MRKPTSGPLVQPELFLFSLETFITTRTLGVRRRDSSFISVAAISWAPHGGVLGGDVEAPHLPEG